jgi:predicted  nucleic acid-binding Zn-ribbon protein
MGDIREQRAPDAPLKDKIRELEAEAERLREALQEVCDCGDRAAVWVARSALGEDESLPRSYWQHGGASSHKSRQPRWVSGSDQTNSSRELSSLLAEIERLRKALADASQALDEAGSQVAASQAHQAVAASSHESSTDKEKP